MKHSLISRTAENGSGRTRQRHTLCARVLTSAAALALTAALVLAAASCGQKDTTGIRAAVIKGPTGIGMASLMKRTGDGKAACDCTFTLASSPDEVVPKLVTGEVDLAAVPTNLAASLYQKTEGGVKMIAVNTLGVLSVLERGETVKTAADLKGKTILSTGQGANPEYILRFVLTENGLDPDRDVKIEFVGTNDELTAALVSGKTDLAMVPEPAATTVLTKAPDLRRALSMNDEWEKICPDADLMMGCVVVRTDFLAEHEDTVKTFLKEYEKSVKACADVKTVAALCEEYGIIPSAAIAEAAIPVSNVTFVAGKEMKERIEGYYRILSDGNPASIGGVIPDENFYYLG